MRLLTENCLLSCLSYFIFALFTERDNAATALSDNTGYQTAFPPKPPPKEIYLCHKPFFYDKFKCGSKPNSIDIANFIMLDVSKLVFNVDQWVHIDVLPTLSASSTGNTLTITHAMIQVTDTANQVIGRIAEQIPCEDADHPQYLEGIGAMSQLYRNPGVKNIKVIECPVTDQLSFNFPPTVGIFSFTNNSVEAFYVNIGFTKEEADFIKNRRKSDRIFITTLLVDSKGECHLHRVEQLNGVPHEGPYENSRVQIPIKCHEAENAFQSEKFEQSPLLMDKPAKWENVRFWGDELGERPRKRIPHLTNPMWKQEILLYNLKFNGLGGQGMTQSEWAEEITKKRSSTGTGLRRDVPLVVVNQIEEEKPSMLKSFDYDDKECDDKLRTKKPSNANHEIGRIYLECKYERQCIGIPNEKCLEERNCDFVASWGKEGDYIVFGVLAHKVTYAAVGISLDDKMGHDSVTECNREPDGLVYGYTSWNYREGGVSGNTRLRSCESMKDFTAELVGDQSIFCSWKRPIKTTVKGITFDLNNAYFILTATGHTTTHGVFGNIGKHEQKNVAIRKAEIMNKYVGKSPFQYFLARIHGMLMIVTWLFIVPVATFASRYLKAMFIKSRICDFSVWFGLHLTLVLIATISTIFFAVLLLIFNNYERAKEDSRFSTHASLGLAVCAMLLVQMGLAYMMLGHHRQQYSVKFYHGMVGHVTALCGHACIITSRDVKDGFPCDTLISYSFYVVIYLILHLFMSYQICYSDFVRGRRISRVYQIFIVARDEKHDQPLLKVPSRSLTLQAEAYRRRRKSLDDYDIENIDDGSVINPHVKETVDEDHYESKKEEPGATMRKIIFFIFLIISGSFTVFYLIIMLLPGYMPDCQSKDIMEPGVLYKAGYLYN